MAYTKTTWAHDTKFTTTNLNNCETQYDEGYGYAVAHNHDTRYYNRTTMQSTFWYAENDGPGSGCDADLLYHADGNMHYADFGSGNIDTYVIIMWDSAVIPDGWHVCDGTAGTPDLRDRFVIGAKEPGVGVGNTGGNNTWSQNYTITVAGHALTESEMPSHNHSWSDDYSSTLNGRGGGDMSLGAVTSYHVGTTASTGSGLSHGHTGSTVTQASADNKPPCVALHYIMKT
jgi:microcystin-dependent protein